MKYKISIASIWRYREDGSHLHPGEYRVPEDMAEDLAQRALTEGVAVKVSTKAGAPENKVAAPAEGKADPLADGGRQSRGSGAQKPRPSSQADRLSLPNRPQPSGAKPARS